MSFNTLYSDLSCPFCKEKVTSGIGFGIGSVNNTNYKIGDKLSWDGPHCRPAKRPRGGNIKSVGHFNCDNIRCQTWNDCYPQVQHALITVKGDVITSVEIYKGQVSSQNFDIIEPKGLS